MLLILVKHMKIILKLNKLDKYLISCIKFYIGHYQTHLHIERATISHFKN